MSDSGDLLRRLAPAWCVHAQPPARVDLAPFIAAIKRMWPGESVGPWLGHVALATELYDHCTGAVAFAGAPVVVAVS